MREPYTHFVGPNPILMMSNEFEIPDDLKSFLTLKDGEANLAIVSVIVEPKKKANSSRLPPLPKTRLPNSLSAPLQIQKDVAHLRNSLETR